MTTLNISGTESNRSGLIKNVLIGALVIVVIGLSVKVHLSNSDSGFDSDDNPARERPPSAVPKDRTGKLVRGMQIYDLCA